MIRLGILGSTRGTHLAALMAAIHSKQLNANVSIVISNKADALILQRASEHALLSICLPAVGLSREAYDQQVSATLQSHQVDIVVLIGYMRILSDTFVKTWSNKIINVHPSLLPAHAGKMDLAVHQAVIDAREKETGCTVHYVTAEVDAGPILLQKKCEVFATDTADQLKARVQPLEAAALIEAINHIQIM